MAQIIDPSSLSGDRIKFGATVTLLDLDTDDEVVYQIVGEDEANAEHGRISVHSPLARAMINKEEGDEIIVRTPRGERNMEVQEIKFV